MCTPDLITWIRKGWLCVHLPSSHGPGRLAMCTPGFITWIRKAAYVYTWLHHMDQEVCICIQLTSSHVIRKAGYVYS